MCTLILLLKKLENCLVMQLQIISQHFELVLMSLYFSFVRPHLEFVAVTWCPVNTANINKIQ